MRVLILSGFLLLSLRCYSADEIEPPPVDDKNVSEEVHSIAMLAATVESRLRDDNHDHSLQRDSQEVIDRIEKLIKDAEEAPLGKGKTQRECDLKQLRGDYGPVNCFQLVQAVATDPKRNINYKDGNRDEWARLPRAQRDEILQTYTKEFPLLWRNRIAAYFLSLNAVEIESNCVVKKK